MEVLLGTTNPSKVSMFERWLEGEDVHFLTLSEVAVPGEPGGNPETVREKMPAGRRSITDGMPIM